MNEHVDALFQKAHRALDTARAMVRIDDAEAAINRAYYGAFYAATAALLSRDIAARTHAGVHRQFHEQFVRTGAVVPDLAER